MGNSNGNIVSEINNANQIDVNKKLDEKSCNLAILITIEYMYVSKLNNATKRGFVVDILKKNLIMHKAYIDGIVNTFMIDFNCNTIDCNNDIIDDDTKNLQNTCRIVKQFYDNKTRENILLLFENLKQYIPENLLSLITGFMPL